MPLLNKKLFALSMASAFLLLTACQTTDHDSDNTVVNLPGGSTTLRDASSKAFSSPAPNLSASQLDEHATGDAAFEAKFVTAPAANNAGLGPVFNNTSCSACHSKDGRGRPPEAGELLSSMLFRISKAGTDVNGGPLTMDNYGTQLQPRAIFGENPEGQVIITYYDSLVHLADGETVTLKVPNYQLNDLYMSLSAPALLSPRIAPPVFGLGLLEALDEASIVALADESDKDNDGISGRPNYVINVLTGKKTLGRFGLKSNTPNLLQQCAAAYNNDMGVTSWIFPQETCFGQSQKGCGNVIPEVDSVTVAAVTFYVRTLAVPARRNVNDAQVQAGEKIFRQLQCNECHIQELKTGNFDQHPELSQQIINPYTDLLLHDMGDALSDNRPDFLANGNEWRTPPLWGIGLTEVVNGHTQFLHDGRANNFTEAILWHGGEATKSRIDFQALKLKDRQALLGFLKSL